MTPTEIAADIVARIVADSNVTAAGLLSAHYPAPGYLPVVPTLVLWWDGFEKVEGMGEQNWIARYRGQLFTAVDDVPDAIAAADPIVAALADTFDASANQANFTLGYQTDGCQLVSGQMGRKITYAGKECYGGDLSFEVQFSRFAGS